MNIEALLQENFLTIYFIYLLFWRWFGSNWWWWMWCWQIVWMISIFSFNIWLVFSVHISENGQNLYIAVTLPDFSANLKHLQRKWPHSKKLDRIEMHHPKLIGFEYYVKSWRFQNIDSSESIGELIYRSKCRPICLKSTIWVRVIAQLELYMQNWEVMKSNTKLYRTTLLLK